MSELTEIRRSAGERFIWKGEELVVVPERPSEGTELDCRNCAFGGNTHEHFEACNIHRCEQPRVIYMRVVDAVRVSLTGEAG